MEQIRLSIPTATNGPVTQRARVGKVADSQAFDMTHHQRGAKLFGGSKNLRQTASLYSQERSERKPAQHLMTSFESNEDSLHYTDGFQDISVVATREQLRPVDKKDPRQMLYTQGSPLGNMQHPFSGSKKNRNHYVRTQGGQKPNNLKASINQYSTTIGESNFTPGNSTGVSSVNGTAALFMQSASYQEANPQTILSAQATPEASQTRGNATAIKLPKLEGSGKKKGHHVKNERVRVPTGANPKNQLLLGPVNNASRNSIESQLRTASPLAAMNNAQHPSTQKMIN